MRTVNGRPTAGLVWQRSSFDSVTETITNSNDYAQSASDVTHSKISRNSGNSHHAENADNAGGGRGCLQLGAERGALLLRGSDEPETVLTTRPARVAALLFAIKAGGWRARKR